MFILLVTYSICLFLGGDPPLLFTFSIRPSIHCTPFLRNFTPSNHNLWYTCVKWYLQVPFLFFWNFHFMGCYGGKREKKKKPKMKNNYYNLSHAISQEQYSIWSWFFGTLALNDISSCCCFFIFLKFSFFGQVSIFW